MRGKTKAPPPIAFGRGAEKTSCSFTPEYSGGFCYDFTPIPAENQVVNLYQGKCPLILILLLKKLEKVLLDAPAPSFIPS